MSVGIYSRSSSKRSTVNLCFSNSKRSMPLGLTGACLGAGARGGLGGGATLGSGNAALRMAVGWLKLVCFSSSLALLLFEGTYASPLLAEGNDVTAWLYGAAIAVPLFHDILVILGSS